MNFLSASKKFWSLIALLTSLALHLNALPPSRARMQDFYQQYIAEGRSFLPGVAPNTDDVGRFDAQKFFLWEYFEGVKNGEFPARFAELQNFVVQHKIKRVIMYIPDPNAFTFFQPNSAFVTAANRLITAGQGVNPDFTITVFFDLSTFGSSAPAQDVSGFSNAAPAYFANAAEKMDWVKAVAPSINGLAEFAFDPEGGGSTKNTQQQLYLFADEYKYTYDLTDLGMGTTLGIDEAPEAYANVSTFPIDAQYIVGLPAAMADTTPTWRTGGSTDPMMTSVYIQFYESDIPAIFAAGATNTSASHDGKLAASYTNDLFFNRPYVTGQGKIKGTQGSSTLLGQGTQFLSLADPIFFTFEPALGRTNKISVKDGDASSNTSTPTTSAAFSTNGFQDFTRTEISVSWRTQPVIDQEMVNRIYWMFSVNYNTGQNLRFFGNWTLNDFMDFIEDFPVVNNDGTRAVFTDSAIPTHNIGIYDYNLLKTVTNGQTTYNGTVINWHLF